MWWFMRMKDRAQSSLEFIVILCLVLVFFVLLLNFMMGRADEFVGSQKEQSMEYVLNAVEKEILIAKGVSGDYHRQFSLPEFDEMDYSFNIVNNLELVVISDEGELVRFLSEEVSVNPNMGILTAGDSLKIVKEGSGIGFCTENCTFDDGRGELQCRNDGFYTNCTFDKYGDNTEDVRFKPVQTPSCDLSLGIDPVCTLDFYAENDGYGYTAGSFENTGFDSTYIFFEDINFYIEESGWWDVNISCVSDCGLGLTSYVPYGYFEFNKFELIDGDDCKDNSSGVFCEANKNFTFYVEAKCLGGECGDVEVWLDP